jgi:hypothetical protein
MNARRFRTLYRPEMIDPDYDRAMWGWAFRIIVLVILLAAGFFWLAYLWRTSLYGN